MLDRADESVGRRVFDAFADQPSVLWRLVRTRSVWPTLLGFLLLCVCSEGLITWIQHPIASGTKSRPESLFYLAAAYVSVFLVPLAFLLVQSSTISTRRQMASVSHGLRWAGEHDEKQFAWGLGFSADLAVTVSSLVAYATLFFLATALGRVLVLEVCFPSGSGTSLLWNPPRRSDEFALYAGGIISDLLVFGLLTVGVLVDRILERRLVFTLTATSICLTSLVIAHAVEIQNQAPLFSSPVTAALRLELEIMVLTLAVVGLGAVALLILTTKTTRSPRRPLSQHQQLRYVKTLIVLPVLSLCIFVGALMFTRQNDLVQGSNELLVIGIAWVASLPPTVGAFAFLALYLIQGMTREKWVERAARNARRRKKRTNLDRSQRREETWARVSDALYSVVDDYSAGVSIVAGAFHAHPLTMGIGLTLNMAFSLMAVRDAPSLPIQFAFGASAAGPVPAPALGAQVGLSNLTVLNLWLGSLAAWLGPLMVALSVAQRSLVQVGLKRVSWALSRAENHIVIGGFGHLGRRVAWALFERRIVDLGQLRDRTDIFLPNGRRGFLLEGLVVIENNHSHFALRGNTGRVELGLVRLEVPTHLIRPRPAPLLWRLRQGPEEERSVFALAILGDVKEENTLREARVEFAGQYICLARDPDAAGSSADYLRSINDSSDVQAFIAAHSSSAPAFLSYRSWDHPICFEHLAIMRSGSMAISIANAAESRRKNNDDPLRLLIACSGLEVFYLIDAVLRYLPESTFGRITVGIVSEDPALERRVDMSVPRVPAGWRSLLFEPHLGRHVEHLKRTCTARVAVEWFAGDPASDTVMRRAIEMFRPDIVAAAEPRWNEQLRVLKAIIRSLEIRNARERQLCGNGEPPDYPTLIAAAETGSPGRSDSVGDGVKYHYATLELEGGSPDPFYYPRRLGFADHNGHQILGDAVVDVLDDPASRITSIVRNFKSKRLYEARAIHPLQVSLCMRSGPGALAATVSRLCGLELVAVRDTDPKAIPTLQGTRMHILSENFLLVETTATLVSGEGFGAGRAPAAVRASISALGSSPNEIKKFRTGALAGLAPSSDPAFQDRATLRQTGWWCTDCPDMAGCHVAAARRTAEALRIDGTSKSHYFASKAAPENPPPPRPEPLSAGSRLIFLSRQGDRPGVFARVLSLLVLGRAEKSEDRDTPTFNLAYAADEPCHASPFSVVTLYGGLQLSTRPRDAVSKRRRRTKTGDSAAFEMLMIRPTAVDPAWDEYARELARHVCEMEDRDVHVLTCRRDDQEGAVLFYMLATAEGGKPPVDLPRIADHLPGSTCIYCDPTTTYSAQRRFCREIRAALHGLPAGSVVEGRPVIFDASPEPVEPEPVPEPRPALPGGTTSEPSPRP